MLAGVRRLLIAAAVLLAACTDAPADDTSADEVVSTTSAAIESTTSTTTIEPATDEPSPSPSPTIVPATTTTTPVAPIDPNDERLVTCATIEGLPLGTLASVEPLDHHPNVADGVTAWLTGDPSGYWERDWWVVHRVDDAAHLAAVDADGLHLLRFVPADGAWIWDDFATAAQGGRCVLEFTRPPTDSILEFEVIGASPDDETIVLRAVEIDCASGEAMGDRFNEPVVELTSTEARIFLSATRLIQAECPGHPSTIVEIVLTEPLGDRTVVDGFVVGVDLATHLASLIDAAT